MTPSKRHRAKRATEYRRQNRAGRPTPSSNEDKQPSPVDKLLDEAVKVAAARLAIYIIAYIKAAMVTNPDPVIVQHAVLLLDALNDFAKGIA